MFTVMFSVKYTDDTAYHAGSGSCVFVRIYLSVSWPDVLTGDYSRVSCCFVRLTFSGFLRLSLAL